MRDKFKRSAGAGFLVLGAALAYYRFSPVPGASSISRGRVVGSADVETLRYLVIGIVVLFAMSAIPAIETVRRWFRGTEKRDIGPNPLTVQAVKEYAALTHEHSQYLTRQDHRDVHRESQDAILVHINAMQSQMAGLTTTIHDFNTAAEQRATSTHKRIDDLVRSAAGTKERLAGHIEEELARRSKGAPPHG
jgi:hypothetical protein